MTMPAMHTDTRFFTNTEANTLLGRFQDSITHAQFFDVLVGYFRASGFHLLRDALQDVEKIRILVGLSVDAPVLAAVQNQHTLPSLFVGHEEARSRYADDVTAEVENAPDTSTTEDSIRTFMAWLQSGKIELKGHPARDIHAKVYISRFRGNLLYGSVITGSSNFSASGFAAQREFNVELKDRPDVDFALARFEELWAEGVDLTQAFVDTVTRKTWLNEAITPYEIYLKVLYEYFQEDINLDAESDLTLPEGMYNLEYQRQAVTSAARILNAHNGVFLADVVGLGKTYITAMLLQTQPGRKLVICPPVLREYWVETLRQFLVPHVDVVSLGKLDQLRERNLSRYALVVVDEAHRFRNENTQGHALLKEICAGKKVVLLSATPLNNRMEDILAQLKLFQAARRSTIPGVPNLERFFQQRAAELKNIPREDPEYPKIVSKNAALVRDKVLKHVMVRRTRSEVRRYFSADLQAQGLSFPEMGQPERIIYRFDPVTAVNFAATIEALKGMSYARYKPLLYLVHPVDALKAQSQHNISGFMKSILVKRLESSFHAFRGTVSRFIASHQAFLRMLDAGQVYMGKGLAVSDLQDLDDDSFFAMVEAHGGDAYPASAFQPELREAVQTDLLTLQHIASLWKTMAHDPKFDAFATALREHERLVGEKALIFTESQETALYLTHRLEELFPSQAILFSSKGGEMFVDGKPQRLSVYDARERILRNFDPGHEAPENTLRLLIATDILAEGINLHRAGRIINYDLPWNPTRVMQRVGRINRVGSKHATLHIFNFFPTDDADAHLDLERNIINKINAFHTVLGEDDRYLSEEEDPTPQGLFGQQLIRRLSDTATLDGEAEVDTDLKYLEVIRRVRDKEPELFEHVKRLPKKARTARMGLADTQAEPGLLVFFHEGQVKKFVHVAAEATAPLPHVEMPPLDQENALRELTFLEAAAAYACEPDTLREALPAHYFDLLAKAKEWLETQGEGEHFTPALPVTDRKLLHMLKGILVWKGYTEADIAYLRRVVECVEEGRFARPAMKRLSDSLARAVQNGPAACLAAIREAFPEHRLPEADGPVRVQNVEKREVILAEYFC